MPDPTPTLAIVVTFPFTKRDAERYHLALWQQAGFDVIVLNLTSIVQPGAPRENKAMPGVKDDDSIFWIRSVSGINEILEGISSSHLVVLYSWPRLHASMAPYIDCLRRHADLTVAINAGSQLPTSNGIAEYPLLLRSMHRLRLFFRPRIVFEKIRRKLIGNETQAWAPTMPDLVFYTSEVDRQRSLAALKGHRAEQVATHVFDQDLYNSSKHVAEGKPKNVCLFLDECMDTNHAKQVQGDMSSPLDIDAYASSMNRLFDSVEAETGLEVIIALHPRAKYHRNIFGGRRLVSGKTPELAHQAKLFILHRSTSFNFVALSRMPCLFVITNEMLEPAKSNIYPGVAAFAREMRQPAINIDKPSEFAQISFDASDIRHDLYDSYVSQFISADGQDGPSQWDTLHQNILRKLNEIDTKANAPRN